MRLILNRDNLNIATDRPLIKSCEHSLIIEADQIIDHAHLIAERITNKAKEEANAAVKEGYSQGYAEGLRLATERLIDATITQQERMAKLNAYVRHAVVAGVRSVLGELPAADVLDRLVKQALASTQPSGKLRLRVAPGDLDFVTKSLSTLTPGNAEVAIEPVADAQLSPMACVLESDVGSIDASLSTQLQALERALRQELEQSRDNLK